MFYIFDVWYVNGLRWPTEYPSDNKSSLVKVMTWCHQTPSHYLRQCWPNSMTSYAITRPQWVKAYAYYVFFIKIKNKFLIISNSITDCIGESISTCHFVSHTLFAFNWLKVSWIRYLLSCYFWEIQNMRLITMEIVSGFFDDFSMESQPVIGGCCEQAWSLEIIQITDEFGECLLLNS